MTCPSPISTRVARAMGFARACYARHFPGDPAIHMERSLLALNFLRQHGIDEEQILSATVLHRLLADGICDRALMAAEVGDATTNLAEQAAAQAGSTWKPPVMKECNVSYRLRLTLLADRYSVLESMPDGAWRGKPRLRAQAWRFAGAMLCFDISVGMGLTISGMLDRLTGKGKGRSP